MSLDDLMCKEEKIISDLKLEYKELKKKHLEYLRGGYPNKAKYFNNQIGFLMIKLELHEKFLQQLDSIEL